MTPIRKAYVHRDNIYGEIDGVKPGEWWETRMECSQAGVHRYVNFTVTINVYLIWSRLSYPLDVPNTWTDVGCGQINSG